MWDLGVDVLQTLPNTFRVEEVQREERAGKKKTESHKTYQSLPFQGLECP